MEPKDADAYFGQVIRHLAPTTRRGKADALSVFFQYLELRHSVELYSLTGIAVRCPLDEMNRQRGTTQLLIRVPPSEREISDLFQGGLTCWRPAASSPPARATSRRHGL
ncbi:hypothetical protein HRW23_28875 [Streptomyces lunaelactis]|uniref:hypothetical protein n=1 Tax=Streptomyces lunaelactis TaxID=1535768 RepID=UPI00131F11D5|nr:hypothetical protein [Streptomyces lunaelactis]NUK06551.1 hypothetical protein [Streptomyces lunaelactis]NUK26843.1 hypothetical protein [Streptomyces lunaelactis]NUK36816.1 hypothetical protein [Streptomyces lunaelactis]NUK45936.1 hypothetical protein [Streptomyces lunaelactis]NUK54174.1 hypothetical protein [Streptomyces lunaelactis]